jgi:hypothetical protein
LKSLVDFKGKGEENEKRGFASLELSLRLTFGNRQKEGMGEGS